MASKRELTLSNGKTVQGYDHNGVLGAYLHEETNLWRGVHIASGRDICGPDGRFKRKRSCLAFIDALASLDWSMTDEEEHYERNGGFDALVPVYAAAVKCGEELE